jgi:hypothetical protein
LDAAGAELDLVGGDGGRGSVEIALGCSTAEEGDVHPSHQVVAELEIAGAVAVGGGRCRVSAEAGADLQGDHRRLTLGEDARLRGLDTDDVTDGVDVVERRGQGERVHRDPPVDGESRLLRHGRGLVDGHAEEQVVGKFAAVAQHGHPPLGVGGHLKGVDVTPTITWPPSKAASTWRRANAPSIV